MNFVSNHSRALKCYDEVLKRNTDFAALENNKKKDYFSASREIMKAISAKPSLAVAHKNLVKITTGEDAKP